MRYSGFENLFFDAQNRCKSSRGGGFPKCLRYAALAGLGNCLRARCTIGGRWLFKIFKTVAGVCDNVAMPEIKFSAAMPCRPGCAACCIAPSISSLGKAAGEPCVHLDQDLRCSIFDRPERPACCAGLQPSLEMCGETREQALGWLSDLEVATHP